MSDTARIAEAESYVTTRFYPPLPREYGVLAVTAVDRVNAGDETPVEIPLGLPVKPRAAYLDETTGPDEPEHWVIDPQELVDILRLWHLID